MAPVGLVPAEPVILHYIGPCEASAPRRACPGGGMIFHLEPVTTLGPHVWSGESSLRRDKLDGGGQFLKSVS